MTLLVTTANLMVWRWILIMLMLIAADPKNTVVPFDNKVLSTFLS